MNLGGKAGPKILSDLVYQDAIATKCTRTIYSEVARPRAIYHFRGDDHKRNI